MCTFRSRTADGRELPLHPRQEIERECRRLWLAVEMMAEVEAEQQQAAKAAETAATESRAAAQLSSPRDVGPATANVLADEVFFRDFKNRRALAGYFGLVSSPWSSGAVNRDQGLAGSGNPRARRAAGKLMIALWKSLTLGVIPEGAVVNSNRKRVSARRPFATERMGVDRSRPGH